MHEEGTRTLAVRRDTHTSPHGHVCNCARYRLATTFGMYHDPADQLERPERGRS